MISTGTQAGEEFIYVLAGSIEQWVDTSCQVLETGDAVIIPAGCVHASFNNTSSEAVLLVVLTPVSVDAPLTEDASEEAPWCTLRTHNP